MDKDALVHRLGDLLREDPEIVGDDDWRAITLVAICAPGHLKLNGFRYDDAGCHTMAAPSIFETLDVIRELHASMAAEAGAAPWCSCLIRLAHDTRRLTLEFEYSDPARWAITFANSDERAEALRPR